MQTGSIHCIFGVRGDSKIAMINDEPFQKTLTVFDTPLCAQTHLRESCPVSCLQFSQLSSRMTA